jgi:hypothetical protein
MAVDTLSMAALMRTIQMAMDTYVKTYNQQIETDWPAISSNSLIDVMEPTKDVAGE